ncbi:cytochrome c1 [Magnetospira sp. QH-2]|uniref:cytochrome c1 n=1 Tax=Magnetospira sp. (strain QH-2) TaxID=1288970 RepID=UPI0003E812A8|nr:cytochrome c1 [Magnetospira sp. QH-2]CCQ72645.1 Cytochrome c1 [Magnetospira sp. QH-2]
MKTTFIRTAALAAVLAVTLGSGAAQASSAPKPPMQDWTFKQSGLRIAGLNIMTGIDIFVHFDKAQLKRGFQVFKEVCNSCHSLDLIAYRNLSALGYTEDEIKEIAAEYEVLAGPDDEGEVLDEDGEFLVRPALPADRFNAPFPNPQAAMASNAGALPPDLSLITKARFNGPDYLYALLTGYEEETPEGYEAIPEDKSWNHWFPGHAISMAPPLYDEAVEYEDGTPATLDQHARDVTAFLSWAAEPELEERASLGLKVVGFLIIFSVLLFALKKQIWRDLH